MTSKADVVHRSIAKIIDFLIAGLFFSTMSYTHIVGLGLGILYLLISDGFMEGRSIGKKLIGLYVVVDKEGDPARPCSFKESIVRNTPFAIAALFGMFPFLWLILFPVSIVILLIEGYFVYADERGVRLGDLFADTRVCEEAARQTEKVHEA